MTNSAFSDLGFRDLTLDRAGLDPTGGDEAAGDDGLGEDIELDDGYEGVLSVELRDPHFSIGAAAAGKVRREVDTRPLARPLELSLSPEDPLGE